MAKRLSSLFSLSREDKSRPEISPSAKPPAAPLSQSITQTNTSLPNKLHKNYVDNSSRLESNVLFPQLDPPPLLSESGLFIPPSSQRSGPDSGLSSRASSPYSFTPVQSRDGSRSRPQTPIPSVPLGAANAPGQPATPTSAKVKKRSWIPGKHDRHEVTDEKHQKAWIAGLEKCVGYDLTPLVEGERVPDLWNDQGDTYVHLYPQSSGRGACFKIDSVLLADSQILLNLCRQSSTFAINGATEMDRMKSAFSESSMTSRPIWPPSQGSSIYRSSPNFSVPNSSSAVNAQKHLYLPLGFDEDLSQPGSEPQRDDLELVLLYRNFIAFLAGGALVASPRQLTLFTIFMGISTVLKRFCFTNSDGSTLGDVPTSSFSRYCDELRLADVRSSREKTIEAIVLGENLRSWSLYNEGFAHAVGRLADIKSLKSLKYGSMSPITINRLERAQLDLEQRLTTLREKLEDFDFPSMFAGIANSQSSTEAKVVRFKEWKSAFLDFRRFTVSYYRRKYGAWPPKASSKKNNFEESGLNRVLLQELYQDFTDLYDALVDRSAVTTRTVDMPPMDEDAESNDQNESIQHATRRVESEYDRATPPVMPPIPFDTPLIPQFSHSFNREHVVISDKSALQNKKLKESEVNEVLLGSYNRESLNGSTWIQEFLNYERRLGNGKTLEQVVDARCGQWLFLYAVLQALPMTVVDASDLQYTEGVEHFLCVAPRGGRPWMKEDQSTSRAWYNVASGGGVVNLPSELIDHGAEGIYRRSHCWIEATKWVSTAQSDLGSSPQPPDLPYSNSPSLTSWQSPDASPQLSPFIEPIHLTGSNSNYLRSNSRDRSSVNLGLEAMDTPPPQQGSRPTSTFNPNITFDAILGIAEEPKTRGKKGKK